MGNLYSTGTSASGAGNRIRNYDLIAYGNFGFDNTTYYPTSLNAQHKFLTGCVVHEDIIADAW